jgi:hypothetical protein
MPTSGGIAAPIAEFGVQGVAVPRKRVVAELTAALVVQHPITDRPATIASAPPHERRT